MKVKKVKLLNKHSNLIELYNAKPKDIENPYNKVTPSATIYSVIHVSLFLLWIYWVYNHYIIWYRNKLKFEELSEYSLTKIGIPVVIISVILEYLIGLSKLNKETNENYRLLETISSFSNAIIQLTFEMWTSILGEILGIILIVGVPYKWIYDNYGITNIFEGNLIGFILTIILKDLCYYWFHRLSHRCSLLWAIHSVHHQPQSYSLHVAIGQGAFDRIAVIIFYCPLALLFPPEIFKLIIIPMELYGYFTHTGLVCKPHLISNIFVTPSFHRVHHAGAPNKYIDKNYSETFSFWDKLFNTYQDEDEPIVFGHCSPIDTWNPINSQLLGWIKIYEKSKTTPFIWKKLLCIFKPPGWNPITNEENNLNELNNSTPFNSNKYDSKLPNSTLNVYLIFWYIFVIWVSATLFILHNKFTITEILVLSVYLFYSFYSFGCLSDIHSYFVLNESIRLFATPFIIYFTNITKADNDDKRLIIAVTVSILSIISVIIILCNRNYFIEEKQNEREKRVWIKEAGREYTYKLNDALKKQ